MKQSAFSFKPTAFYLTAVAITLFSKNQSASLLVLSDYLDSSFYPSLSFLLKRNFLLPIPSLESSAGPLSIIIHSMNVFSPPLAETTGIFITFRVKNPKSLVLNPFLLKGDAKVSF